jgi:hypothetical protein
VTFRKKERGRKRERERDEERGRGSQLQCSALPGRDEEETGIGL